MFEKNQSTDWALKFFVESYLSKIWTSTIVKVFPNQHAELFEFLVIEDSLKIKKGVELVSRPDFLYNFSINILFCNITQTGQVLLPDCV